MGRPIKFRAIAAVNDKRAQIKAGDFVYGCFIESGCDAPCIIFGDGEQIEIDRETLGQLTGLKDNGAEIYEGDIVQCKMSFEGGHLPHAGVIVFMEEYGAFATRNDAGDTLLHNHITGSFEVIDNIHANKDWL